MERNYSAKVTLSPHSGLVDSEFSAVRKTNSLLWEGKFKKRNREETKRFCARLKNKALKLCFQSSASHVSCCHSLRECRLLSLSSEEGGLGRLGLIETLHFNFKVIFCMISLNGPFRIYFKDILIYLRCISFCLLV